MLVMIGVSLSILVSLWYSFFNLITTEGTAGRALAIVAAGLMGALLVVGPTAYWLYTRVTGEEAEHPELTKKTVRTVFLTIWVVPAVISLVSLAVSVVSSFVMGIFGVGGDAAALWVGRVLPGLFAVAAVGLGIRVVLKHATRKVVMMSGLVVSAIAVFLLLANRVMVAVRKDVRDTPKNTITCTYREYLNKNCTYREYMQKLQDNSSTPSNSLYDGDFNQLFN